MAGVARGTFARTSSRLESRFSSARGNFLAITSTIDPADSLRLLRNERESKRATLAGRRTRSPGWKFVECRYADQGVSKGGDCNRWALW